MKKSKIVNITPEATHNSVYIFHNTEFNINLFVNACGASEADLRAAKASPGVQRFVLEQAERIAREFAAGWPLMNCVEGRLRLELRAILHGAAAVLQLIRSVDGDVLSGKVHLSKLRRLRTVFQGLFSSREPKWSFR